MKFSYIYTNKIGETCFDSYFDYIEQVKDLMPDRLRLIAGDKRRYLIEGDLTLHDSKIINLNQKFFLDHNDDTSSSYLTLDLESRHRDRVIRLEYGGAFFNYIGVPDKWIIRPVDLLCHEFSVEENFYRHRIKFDRGVWMDIRFDTFNFQEQKPGRAG